jgi:hypothetical protein
VDERILSLSRSGSGMDAVNSVLKRYRLTDTKGGGRVIALVKQVLGWIAFWVQLLLVFIVMLVSAFGLMQLGLFVATGLSLWRLIQHDYGNTDGDPSKANMNPALSILYILVVIQGATLAYRFILRPMRRKIVDQVVKNYSFAGPELLVGSVSDYYHYLRKRCSKDPTFANEKNLVTYAVELMGSNKSPEEYQSGTRILGALLGPFFHAQSEKFNGRRRLTKQLIRSPSSSHILQKLLKILSFPYHIGTRKYAAAHVANEIDLEQFPRGIQGISSLIDTFEEYHTRAFFSD